MERRLWNEVSIYLDPGRWAELLIMGLNLAPPHVPICTATI